MTEHPAATTDISTANDFFFGSNGQQLAPMLPVVITTRDQAYRTAAYLELMGSVLPPEDADNPPIYDAIRTAIANT